MSRKSILTILVLVIMSSFVLAASFNNQLFPTAFTTLTSTSVNFSTTFNQTGETAENHWSIKIYNSSDPSSTRLYQTLGIMNVTNGTMGNITLTLKDDTRTWWYMNVTNISVGAVLSDVRIFDVDADFLVFKFGGYDKINFTVDRGDINISGKLRANNITLKATDGAEWECGVNETGQVHCTSR